MAGVFYDENWELVPDVLTDAFHDLAYDDFTAVEFGLNINYY